MPGAVARTSTHALTNATFPFALEIANKGWQRAAKENPAIATGLNLAQGRVYYAALARQFNKPLATL